MNRNVLIICLLILFVVLVKLIRGTNPTWGVKPLIVILVIVIIFLVSRNKSIGTFKNCLPRLQYTNIVNLYGKPNLGGEGILIWNNENMACRGPMYAYLYDSIELRDEQIRNCVPIPHYVYLYTNLKVFIPPHKVFAVSRLSNAMYYNSLKRVLTVGSNCLVFNVVVFWLVLKIVTSAFTLIDVMENKLFDRKLNEVKEDCKAVDEMEKDIHLMVKMLNSLAPPRLQC
jgi:hypothetical protein